MTYNDSWRRWPRTPIGIADSGLEQGSGRLTAISLKVGCPVISRRTHSASVPPNYIDRRGSSLVGSTQNHAPSLLEGHLLNVESNGGPFQ